MDSKSRKIISKTVDEYVKEEKVDKKVGEIYKKLYGEEECLKNYYKGEYVDDEYKGKRIEEVRLSEGFRKFLEKEVGEIEKVKGVYEGYWDDGDMVVDIKLKDGRRLLIEHYGRGFKVSLGKNVKSVMEKIREV